MEAHLAHNQEYAGSSPVSATLLLLVGLVGFGSEDIKSQK